MASSTLRFIILVVLLVVALFGSMRVSAQVIDPAYDCPEDGQFEHPDCWKWYNCGEGIAYVMECPNDWLYDPDNIWCEFPENVDCGDRNPRPPSI